jgi:hypothetical protein
LSIDIKSSNEETCISLLCFLLDSWDRMEVAIGSNATTLKLDDVVASLLLKEMREKTMDSQPKDALFMRGHSVDRIKNRSSEGRSKSRGRYKSLEQSLRKC